MGTKQLSDGGDDGCVMGQSPSDKLGCYGLETPIVKATITLGAGTTTTLLKADVLAIATALHNLGILTEAGL